MEGVDVRSVRILSAVVGGGVVREVEVFKHVRMVGGASMDKSLLVIYSLALLVSSVFDDSTVGGVLSNIARGVLAYLGFEIGFPLPTYGMLS